MPLGKAKRAGVEALGQSRSIFEQAPTLTAFNPFNIQTGFGTVSSTPDTFSAFLSPSFQKASDVLTGTGTQNIGFGQNLLGLGGAGLFSTAQSNPLGLTSTLFNRLESVLNPVRERQRSNLESRLLEQGRLGSTGGSLQQQAFEEAVNQQQLANLSGAFQQALAQQAQQASLFNQLAGLGLNTQSLGQGQVGSAFGLQQGVLQPLQLSGMFGNLQSEAGARALSGMGIGLQGTLGAANAFAKQHQLGKKTSFGEGLFALGSGVLGGLAGGIGTGLGGAFANRFFPGG